MLAIREFVGKLCFSRLIINWQHRQLLKIINIHVFLIIMSSNKSNLNIHCDHYLRVKLFQDVGVGYYVAECIISAHLGDGSNILR